MNTFLIMLSLIGHTAMATYTSNNTIAPNEDGVFSSYQYGGTDIFFAHSYLAGRYFYDQQIGDRVYLVQDGEVTVYKVIGIHTPAITDFQWSDFDPYLEADALLFTCWDGGAGRGYGRPVGRLIVELEVYNEQIHRHMARELQAT